MKTTLLAKKKINNLLIGGNISDFENKVRSKFIYDDLKDQNGFIRCTTKNIWMIAYRSWYYGVGIIGVESNIDEDVPFYDFCIEDYVDDLKNFAYHH